MVGSGMPQRDKDFELRLIDEPPIDGAAAGEPGAGESGERKIELRVIDESTNEVFETVGEADVDEFGKNKLHLRVIRESAAGPESGAEGSGEADTLLEGSGRKAGFLRSHEPGIEVLIEDAHARLQEVEDKWQQESAKRALPWGWFTLVGLAMCSALVWSLLRVQSSKTVAEEVRTQTLEQLMRTEASKREALELIERMKASLREYFAATAPDALERVVRHPQRVRPLMEQHYAMEPRKPKSVREVRRLEPVTLGDRGNFWRATVALDDGTLERVALEILDSDEPRVDWETHVCHQPMPWDEFVRKRPVGQPMDFRVYVEPDGKLPESPEIAAAPLQVRLTTRGAGEFLFGTAAAGSPAAESIQRSLADSSRGRASLILRLVFPEDSAAREVLIKEVVNERWIYLDDPGTR